MDEIEQNISGLLRKYLPFIPESIITAAAIFFVAFYVFVKYIWPIIEFLFSVLKKKPEPPETNPIIRPEVKVLRDVWLKERDPDEVKDHTTSYRNLKVVTIINMKGGVGKTTLTANLGAHLNSKGKRVLFVDYDYQGTLTNMVSGAIDRTKRDVGANSFKTLYQSVRDDPAEAFTMLEPPLSDCSLAGADYKLFRDEMEQFAIWSSGAASFDVRTQLRGFLETEFITSLFDVVLIDCGPRFTTSTINALCASTHFLVPTILDAASADAVYLLDHELTSHRDELFPNLELAGIVPTFVSQDPVNSTQPKFNQAEERQLRSLQSRFASFGRGRVKTLWLALRRG